MKRFKEYTYEVYIDHEETLGSEVIRQIEHETVIQILDQLWMEHLENIKHLRNSIEWHSIGQKDPLVEYRRESQNLFKQMQTTLRLKIVKGLNHLQPHQIRQTVDTELLNVS